jgi:hypothetical protein
MLGLRVVGRDPLAVEVVVEVLDLLVAGVQHESSGPAGRLDVVVDVGLTSGGRHVGRHTDLGTGDARHGYWSLLSRSREDVVSERAEYVRRKTPA